MILFSSALAFEPVTTQLSRSTVVNWTEMRVEATAMADPSGGQGLSATEEIARRGVSGEIDGAILRTPIDPGRTVEDLRAIPDLWTQIEPRTTRWVEVETRYHESRRVAVVGAVSLVAMLKPWVMSSAAKHSRVQPSEHTGLVLDARGLEVEPCFSPVLRGPDGELHDARIWLHTASSRPFALWVHDGADPHTARAGDKPLQAQVTEVKGCVLTVDDKGARGIETLDNEGVLGEGTVVVVVD